MLRYAQWALIPTVLFGWLLAAGPATAQKKVVGPPRTVQDDADFFGAAAKSQANAEIAEIKRRFNKDLLFETIVKAPASIEKIDLSNPRERNQYFEQLAEQRANNSQVDGINVLICKQPPHVEVVAGKKTRASGMFTTEDCKVLANKIAAKLRAKEPDQALLQAVTFVHDTLRSHAAVTPRAQVGGAPAPKAGPFGAQHAPGEDDWRSHIFGWVCLGLVALLVIWVIFGMIRAFTAPRGGYMGGPGGGGPGYAGGGFGGGGFGGGGGGFMSGMLGGMFGAVAGNWLYNNLGGGHPTSGGWGGSSAQAGESGQPDAGTDVGGDYQGGGADFGDQGGDQGGGDAGGGADWGGGGGGDAGGGGDWGGGGGDTGGGGGGDWGGGGGGGDFGGGGGGGGDW